MGKEIRKAENVEFEDALTLTGYGRYNICLLFVCGGVLMAVILETMNMSYIVPAAQCDLHLTLMEKSVLSAVNFLGVVLSSLLWGGIGDVIGRKCVLIVTTYISFIITVASSLAPYTWLFIVLRFLSGFFIGGPSAVTYAYLGEFHNNTHRARVLTWAAGFIALATIMLPALAWVILPMEWAWDLTPIGFWMRPWRLYLIINGLPGIISATFLMWYPESPKFLWVNEKHEKVLDILQDMYAINTGNSRELYPVQSLVKQTERTDNNFNEVAAKPTKRAIELFKSMWKQIIPLFCGNYAMKTFMTCTLQFGVFASSSGFFMWTPEVLNKVTYYMQNSNMTLTVCRALSFKNSSGIVDDMNEECNDTIDEGVFQTTVIYGTIFACGYAIIGIVINLTGKKLLLVILLTLSCVSGLALNFIENYLIILIAIGLFLLACTCVGVINTVVVDLYPTQYRAMAMAISLMLGRLGAVVGSNSLGPLLNYNCHLSIYIFAGEYIVLIIISLLLPPPLKVASSNISA